MLNQSQGGTYMAGWLENRVNSGSEGLSFGLQDSSTPVFDLVRSVGQATEELANLLADFGLGPEAGVGRHFGADPAPDGLVRVAIGTVGRQADEAEVQIWSGQ